MKHSSPSGRRTESGSSKRPSKPKPTIAQLTKFDRGFNRQFVAGADEAGRGCLAGPLVAAAVLFDYDRLDSLQLRALEGLNDSKQHDHDSRERLFPIIMRLSTRIAITSRAAPGIDENGLHVTNLAALRDTLAEVGRSGCICLSDGFAVGEIGFDRQAVIGGDTKSAVIAAASIIAKVTRDRFMHRMAERYPGWHFESHVGYSTPKHRAAIEELGVTPLHRMSFASVAYQQLSLTE